MVKLRLRRRGRKSRPVYDIVVADSRSPRDGRYIEKIGQYNPLITSGATILDRDRAAYWLQTGAQPTDTVRDILSREGILLSIHMERKGVAAEEITAAVAAHDEHRKSRESKRNAAKAKPAVEEAAPVAAEPVAEAAAEPVAESAPETTVTEETTEAAAPEAATEETAEAPTETAVEETPAAAAEATPETTATEAAPEAAAAETAPEAAASTEETATESTAPEGDAAGDAAAESDETTAA